VIATGIPHRGRAGHEQFLRECGAVMKLSAGVRRCGAAALDLAWVAAGRFDGFWERNLNPWDIAAGAVLVREAGGFVSDIKGGRTWLETGDILAGNETINRELTKILATCEGAD